jgi:hypothetical protein
METFVIRIWMPDDADAIGDELELRGLAEHVRGGERRAFRGSRELVEFIESALGSSGTSARKRAPEPFE